MKQIISLEQWNDMTPNVRVYIIFWKRKKAYINDLFNLGQCIELLDALTHHHYHDESDGRFFNNSIQNNESTIGYDGEELIDILWYELTETIRKRLSIGVFLDKNSSYNPHV